MVMFLVIIWVFFLQAKKVDGKITSLILAKRFEQVGELVVFAGLPEGS